MELTKEYFDSKFEYIQSRFLGIDGKIDQLRLDMDKKFKTQTEELKKFSREQTDELAMMVNNSFDHVDNELIDIKNKIQKFDSKFDRLNKTLHIEL